MLRLAPKHGLATCSADGYLASFEWHAQQGTSLPLAICSFLWFQRALKQHNAVGALMFPELRLDVPRTAL
jgi:hypothetical protein